MLFELKLKITNCEKQRFLSLVIIYYFWSISVGKAVNLIYGQYQLKVPHF